MRVIIGAGLLLLLGCNRSGLSAGGTPPADLAMAARAADLSLPAQDLSFPSLDLADACHLTMPNATTDLSGHTLAYSWLGNIDEGGESHCAGPPEGVMIALDEGSLPD